MNKYLLALILWAGLVSSSFSEDSVSLDATHHDNTYLHEQISSLEATIASNDRRYEQRFADSEKAVNAALQAADKAVGAALQASKEAVAKAEAANEKHFDSVNEFRKTLGDQAAGFVTKDSLWTGVISAITAIGAMATVYAIIARRRNGINGRR